MRTRNFEERMVALFSEAGIPASCQPVEDVPVRIERAGSGAHIFYRDMPPVTVEATAEFLNVRRVLTRLHLAAKAQMLDTRYTDSWRVRAAVLELELARHLGRVLLAGAGV